MKKETMNNMTISDTDRINYLQSLVKDGGSIELSGNLREDIDWEIKKKWDEPIKEPIRLTEEEFNPKTFQK